MTDVVVVRSSRRRDGDIELARSVAFPGRLVVLAPVRASAAEVLSVLRGQLDDEEVVAVRAAFDLGQQEP
jgi:hypothetical protein